MGSRSAIRSSPRWWERQRTRFRKGPDVSTGCRSLWIDMTATHGLRCARGGKPAAGSCSRGCSATACSAGRTGERLLPATDARNYRQKAQRAFAAELLSPIAALDDFLGGDYSYDNQCEVADRFNVGERAIRTQLVNRRRIAREDAQELVDYGVRSQA